MAEEKLANDILSGVPAIADYVGEKPRQVYHLLETGQLPGFKMPNGREWRARKSTLDKYYERLDSKWQQLGDAAQRVVAVPTFATLCAKSRPNLIARRARSQRDGRHRGHSNGDAAAGRARRENDADQLAKPF